MRTAGTATAEALPQPEADSQPEGNPHPEANPPSEAVVPVVLPAEPTSSGQDLPRLTSALLKVREHLIPCTILLTIALGYRLRELDVPLYGDQALYFYLSKTLGLAPSPVRDLAPLWMHFAVRPFMYTFFWPWANLGMTSFRLANIVMGALVPCLVYALSVRFRVRPALAAIVALAAAVHPVLVSYSGRCFPDNLATALVLAGYLAYFFERTRLSVAALLLTVLAKEAFAMFLLPLVADGAYRFVKTRSRIILAPIAGLAAVVVTNVLSIYMFDGRLQGWASGKPDVAFFKGFLASVWFLPLYALLLLERRIAVLAISLAAPTFFLVWGWLLHRGVEQWYLYGPFCVALVALSVGLQDAFAFVATRPARIPSSSRLEMLRQLASRCCAVALVATIVVLPEQAGWRSWLDLVKLNQVLDQHPKIGPDHAERIAKHLSQIRPKNLLVMDCFWAFAYYPFGSTAQHVWPYYTDDSTDAGARNQLSTLLRKHDYVVTGDSSKNSAQAALFREAFRSCTVSSIGKYAIYSVSPRCLAELNR